MSEPDVLIIGAGMGGLITGAILAKEEGMKVLVL
jgi:phytoene dehydrogenase-like protein